MYWSVVIIPRDRNIFNVKFSILKLIFILDCLSNEDAPVHSVFDTLLEMLIKGGKGNLEKKTPRLINLKKNRKEREKKKKKKIRYYSFIWKQKWTKQYFLVLALNKKVIAWFGDIGHSKEREDFPYRSLAETVNKSNNKNLIETVFDLITH